MAHVAPTSPAPTLATPILHRGRREREKSDERGGGVGAFAVGKMKSECRNANAIAIVKVKLNALRQCLADCAAVQRLLAEVFFCSAVSFFISSFFWYFFLISGFVFFAYFVKYFSMLSNWSGSSCN